MSLTIYNHAETGLPAVDINGEPRLLARLPTPKETRSRFAPVRDKIEVIPRSELVNISRRETMGTRFLLNQRSHGCHDSATEVLTEKGWTTWPDYNWSDLLGTVNPITSRLEFQAPITKHVYDYNGPLFYSKNKSVDFALTPNHRMYVQRWNEAERTLNGHFGMEEVQNLGWYCGLMKSPSGFCGVDLERLSVEGGREFLGDDFLALVALVISDGWVGSTENTKNRVSFCCFREDRYDFVAALAKRIGFHEQPGRKGVWGVTNGALSEWFKANAFTGNIYRSPYKRVPDIVKTVGSRQVSHFLKFFGDQDKDNRTGGRRFYSSSKRMIDDLQEMLLRVGSRGSISQREPRSTRMRDGREIDKENCHGDITLYERAGKGLSLCRGKHLQTDYYKGQVYCATVPNGILVTRRNGSVLISGNSCVGFNSVGGLQRARFLAGQELVRLSGAFVYSKINGGRDNGSNIGDSLTELMEKGTCTEQEAPWDAIYPNRYPASANESAKRFKIEEGYRVESYDEALTAIALGYTLVFACMVGGNFDHLDSEDVVGYDRGSGNHCVLPETLIATTQGMKRADSVSITDRLYGHDGQDHAVTEVMARYFNGNLARIAAAGMPPLTVTEDHPVLVYRRACREVLARQFSGFVTDSKEKPIYRNGDRRYAPAWIMAKDVRPGDYLTTPAIEVPESTDSERDYFLGYYCGNGSLIVEKGRGIKGIHVDLPLHGPIDRVEAEMKNHGNVTRIWRGKNGALVSEDQATSVRLRMSGKDFAEKMHGLIGRYSHEKTLPVLNRCSLEGLVDADGCRYKGVTKFTTVSFALAQQVRLLVTGLGYLAGMTKTAMHSMSRHQGWAVRWNESPSKKRTTVDGGGSMMLVKSVMLLPYSGNVYNYEVEDCQSFLADTVSVHNCVHADGIYLSSSKGWLLDAVNSWSNPEGPYWGNQGRFRFSEKHWDGVDQDAYAIRAALFDPNAEQPPVMK